MDTLLIVLGLCSMILGVLGSFLPVLPGPGLSFLGILLLYYTKTVTANYWLLGISFLLLIALTIIDYTIPAQGTKRFGGSRYGIWGTQIGLIVGLIAPIPLGFVIGPFLGALIGELCHDHQDHSRALRAATGSFIGFLASSFIKFVVCTMQLGYFIWEVWQHKEQLF